MMAQICHIWVSLVLILQKYEPKLFVHGHVHMTYGRDFKREAMYNNTRVINAFERYIIEI